MRLMSFQNGIGIIQIIFVAIVKCNKTTPREIGIWLGVKSMQWQNGVVLFYQQQHFLEKFRMNARPDAIVLRNYFVKHQNRHFTIPPVGAKQHASDTKVIKHLKKNVS